MKGPTVAEIRVTQLREETGDPPNIYVYLGGETDVVEMDCSSWPVISLAITLLFDCRRVTYAEH